MSSLDVERTRDLLTAMTRQPDLTLHVVPADAPCDLRVVSRALLAKDEAFVPLWSERYVVALPAAHPLALRAVLRASDLAGEKVVERCHCEHADLFVRGRAHVPVEVVAIAQSEEWAAALVGAGLGISLVPEGAVREGRGVVLRPLSDVKLSRDVGIAHPRRSVSSEVHRLLESVRRRFAA
jgi:DNA-binding transcriptional LysR family regulator